MSVGQTLAEARNERGFSVEDVSATTRIRATLIRAIEADDYHGCGGDVYARGHIRSIARVLGIEAAPLLEEFDRGHAIEVPLVMAAPLPSTDRAALANSERRSPNWTVAAVLALIVIIGVAGYSLVNSGGGSKIAKAGKLPAPTVTQSTPSTGTTPKPGRSPSRNTTADSGLQKNKAIMQVRATTAETWLEIKTSEGAVLFLGDLKPGQRKLVISKQALDFIIGNAPAVDLVVNGKDIGSPKAVGFVAKGQINPGSQQIQQA